MNTNDDRFDRAIELLERLDRRLGGVEERLGRVEERLGSLDTRVAAVESRVGALESRIREMDASGSVMRRRIDQLEDSQLNLRQPSQPVASGTYAPPFAAPLGTLVNGGINGLGLTHDR